MWEYWVGGGPVGSRPVAWPLSLYTPPPALMPIPAGGGACLQWYRRALM